MAIQAERRRQIESEASKVSRKPSGNYERMKYSKLVRRRA